MGFFQKLMQRLFPANTASGKLPFFSGGIDKNRSRGKDYEEFIDSDKKERILDFIRHQFRLFETDEEDLNMIRILKTNSSNGFILRYPEQFDVRSFRFLFDYFKDKVTELEYYLYTSDERAYERKNHIETIERHYLKPSLRRFREAKPGEPIDQIFGNILIELYFIDDNPAYIKLLANNYNDHKYQKARNFDELISHLCS